MSEDKTKENVIKQKEVLAQESLKVANEAIGLLQDQMSECSTRDLVQIFSAAVKAHREITDDIVVLTTKKETPAEESLAREYDGKVEELLKRIKNY
jgi:hypothetical protein